MLLKWTKDPKMFEVLIWSDPGKLEIYLNQHHAR